MITALKNHPFAVKAFFETSLVFTYAIPKEILANLLPPCLQLDTFNNEWGFIAIAMVATKQLRPKGFPEFMGNDFFLIGCRVFVNYIDQRGKRLRGLYILKSETNKRKMEILGNIFTNYNYSTTDITYSKNSEKVIVISNKSGLDIEINHNKLNVDLPKDSPFKDWKEARRFAGPLPFTFSFNKKTNQVLIIEGVRENWVPKPVQVVKDKIEFITERKFGKIILANAFIIEDVPYSWKKGKLELWKG
jgi:uncharacterized protein YqjF (DUF2071 family)